MPVASELVQFKKRFGESLFGKVAKNLHTVRNHAVESALYEPRKRKTLSGFRELVRKKLDAEAKMYASRSIMQRIEEEMKTLGTVHEKSPTAARIFRKLVGGEEKEASADVVRKNFEKLSSFYEDTLLMHKDLKKLVTKMAPAFQMRPAFQRAK